MPKTVNSTGKRPQYRALEIMEIGKPVTPSAIDKYTGTGNYSSKYMSFLKRDGFVIQVNKDGRSVVSYTLISKPDGAEKLPGATPKVQSVANVLAAAKAKTTKKTAKAKSKAKAKVKVAPVDFSNMALPAKKKIVAVAARKKPIMETMIPQEPFENDGEIAGGSFSVDSGWDDLDPRELA